MPMALPLLAAAGSVGAGMAAVGGTMAGFAAASLGTQLIAGAMIAGGVMTGLGAVTGNKKLQKWGGVLSLAGGIGGLATGAWASTASSVAEGAAQESFRAAELGAQSAADALGGAAGGLADAAGSLVQANAGNDFGMLNSMTGGVTQAPMTPGFNPAAPSIAAPAAAAPSIPSPLGQVGGAAQTALKGATETGGGMLKDGMAWMEKNPKLTQAGAGLLQAGLGAYGQAEAVKDQMRLQDEQRERARQRLSDSVQGVTVPVYQRTGG